MTVKQFIRIRTKMGLNQTELAKMLGISRKTVNSIENNLAPIGKRTELSMKLLKGQYEDISSSSTLNV